MMKRIKPAAVTMMVIVFMALVLAPLNINETAYATESSRRDWDKLAPDGQLKEIATATEYAVLMDLHTGKVLYEENANEKRFPASITKIMTCLLVIENMDLDEEITVPDFSIDDPKATMAGIQPGEKIAVRELLYGLMLASGNDAAEALAIYMSGSVTLFAQLMNERAAELGMTGTHFVNPHGLHDDNHYTTAMDMAKLTCAAMKNPDFREIVSTYEHTPPPTNIHNEENLWNPDVWTNTNNLISADYFNEPFAFNDASGQHATGVKTGYTSAALSTLVGAAINDDGTQEVVSVVLSGDKNERYVDTITMFKYAFEFYDTIDLVQFLTEGLTIKAHVDKALNNDELYNLEMNVVADSEAYMTDTVEKIALINEHPEVFTKVENYADSLMAPIAQGQEVGTVDFYFNDKPEPILSCTLVAANAVAAMPTPSPVPTAEPTPVKATPTPAPGVMEIVKDNLTYIAGGTALIVVLIVIVAVSSKRRKAQHARRHAASARSRVNDTRYREGVQRGRGRRR